MAESGKITDTADVQRLAVLNIVGLSPRHIGAHTPRLRAFADEHGLQSFAPAFPAVTCTAQSHMLTGSDSSTHGIVANGWLDRENAEVRFWKQSNRLVYGEKIWHVLRKSNPDFTCANLFWWYNMATDADIVGRPTLSAAFQMMLVCFIALLARLSPLCSTRACLLLCPEVLHKLILCMPQRLARGLHLLFNVLAHPREHPLLPSRSLRTLGVACE